MVAYLEREENVFVCLFWIYSQWNAKRSKSFRIKRVSVYFFSILSYMIKTWQMHILNIVIIFFSMYAKYITFTS